MEEATQNDDVESARYVLTVLKNEWTRRLAIQLILERIEEYSQSGDHELAGRYWGLLIESPISSLNVNSDSAEV